MMTNSKMTVYNKYNTADKQVNFKKHLIENVFWDDAKIVNLSLGLENADEVNVYIPKDKNDLTKYVKPKKYNAVDNSWTLKEGDYIVRGNVNINEIQEIKELSDYDVFTITSVDDKDFGSPSMQHFEVKGK